MKCPNCDFIERDEAFGNPPTCPKCGAVYAKALRARQLKEAQQPAAPVKPSVVAGVAAGVAQARREREQRELDMASREVIVAGIDIPFWQLVMLMVKVCIAAVPAIFILFILLRGLASFISLM